MNWFVGWADNQSQPMVVVVMIEDGGAFQTGSEMTAARRSGTSSAAYGVKQSSETRIRPHQASSEPLGQ